MVRRIQASPSRVEPLLDVAILGGGMAGLSLAEGLEQAGCLYRVFEGQATLGGRARTNRDAFRAPVDTGATFLHGGVHNPLVLRASRLGLHFLASKTDRFFLDGRPATDEEMVRLHCARDLGAYDAGRFESSDTDVRVQEGMSALIEKIRARIPQKNPRLSSPIAGVRRVGDGVEVHLRGGQVHRARLAACSLPVGVLAHGDVWFDPPLSRPVVTAIQELRMSRMEIVLLEVSGVPDLLERSVHYGASKNLPAVQALFERRLPNGNLLAKVFIGDDTGEAFCGDPEALVDLAAAKLRESYGDRIRMVRGGATQWSQNPYAYGAYSVSGPGQARLREVLRDTVLMDGRLILIGEAMAFPERKASMTGAYEYSKHLLRRRIIPFLLQEGRQADDAGRKPPRNRPRKMV